MSTVSGYDASSRVDDLAAEMNKPVTSISIGSAEGFCEADKANNTAVRSGKWVLLKNVHLAPSWLVTLEKKLHSIQAHSGSRLFLICEINSKLPVNLLRAGRIFTYEPPPRVRVNLLRTFNTVSASRMMKPPNERARMYFQFLSWVEQLEDQTSPDWLGLPINAERVLLAQRRHDQVIKLLRMQQLDEDDEELAYRCVYD